MKNEIWEVRVCMNNDMNYVDMYVRAPTPEAAAEKAHAIAKTDPESYFDIDREDRFWVEYNNITRLDEEECEYEVID
jgi:hypothetical protein